MHLLNVFGSLIGKTYRKVLRKNILSFASVALLACSVGKQRCRQWVGAVVLAVVATLLQLLPGIAQAANSGDLVINDTATRMRSG